MHPFEHVSVTDPTAGRFAAILEPDVVFHSPVFARPITGRDFVAEVLETVHRIFGTPAYWLSLSEGSDTVLLFDGEVEGQTLQVGLGTRPMLLALELGATGTIPSASPSVTPTSAPSPSPSGNTDLQISSPDQGDGILFDTSQLTAPAGARVSLTYTNETSIPHDWHLFDGANASSPSIVSTKIQAGPNEAQNVSFTVPSNPGRYYFQCDVHPTLMNGFLIVH
jgi:plastocyanin